MSLIVKNGTIVTAEETYRGDIEVKDGVIASIRTEIQPQPGDEVIDAANQYVFPGGIDPHVHFSHPDYADSFETGSAAAAVGGITTFVSFCEPPPAGKTLLQNLRDWKEMAKPSCVDYALHPIISDPYCEEFAADTAAFREEGLAAVKLFMSARAVGYYSADLGIYKVLKATGANGMIATVHCENGDVIDQIVRENVAQGKVSNLWHGLSRPVCLEEEATNRVIAIAQVADAPVRIAHVSCSDAVEAIKRGLRRGVRVVAETCPHYLTRDLSDLDKEFAHSSRYVCAPPLRERWNVDALWLAIRGGTLSSVGSDHAPVCYDNARVNKLQGTEAFNKVPNGGPGVEEIFSAVYHFGVAEKRISLNTFAAVMCTNNAKQMGLYPRKGGIHVGGDGDLVVLDPNAKRTLTVKNQTSKIDYNNFEGVTVDCRLTHVIARGVEVAADGVFKGKAGNGRFLHGGDVIA